MLPALVTVASPCSLPHGDDKRRDPDALCRDSCTESQHELAARDLPVRRRDRRRDAPLLGATAHAEGLGLGSLAVSSIARGAPQVTATVSLRTTKLGAILVGPNGHTLYLFAKDRSGKSACAGSCATYWPPLLSRKPTAGKGVKASLLGTSMRSNGSLQVTYAKHPLYGFALDKQAGQANGEGNLAFGAKWWAVSASGTPVLKA